MAEVVLCLEETTMSNLQPSEPDSRHPVCKSGNHYFAMDGFCQYCGIDSETFNLRAIIREAIRRIENRHFGDDGTRIWISDYMDDLEKLLRTAEGTKRD